MSEQKNTEMALSATKENIRSVAEQARTHLSFNDWPHCGMISDKLTTMLPSEINGINPTDVSILTFNISCGYRCDHYAVELNQPNNEPMLVDAAFDQFANETGTPISVAPRSEINSVAIVQPAHEYIFYRDQTKGIL